MKARENLICPDTAELCTRGGCTVGHCLAEHERDIAVRLRTVLHTKVGAAPLNEEEFRTAVARLLDQEEDVMVSLLGAIHDELQTRWRKVLSTPSSALAKSPLLKNRHDKADRTIGSLFSAIDQADNAAALARDLCEEFQALEAKLMQAKPSPSASSAPPRPHGGYDGVANAPTPRAKRRYKDARRRFTRAKNHRGVPRDPMAAARRAGLADQLRGLQSVAA